MAHCANPQPLAARGEANMATALGVGRETVFRAAEGGREGGRETGEDVKGSASEDTREATGKRGQGPLE